MPKTFLSVGVSVAALLSALGCESSTEPKSVEGRYELSAVNGVALPYALGPAPRNVGDTTNEACRLSVSDGALTLGTDRKFVMTYTIANSCQPATAFATSTEIGAYEREGNAFDFRVSDGEKELMFRGIASSGSRIDVAGSPFALSFTR